MKCWKITLVPQCIDCKAFIRAMLRSGPYCILIRRLSTNAYAIGRRQMKAWVFELDRYYKAGKVEEFCAELKQISVSGPNSQSISLLDHFFTSQFISKLNAKLTGQVIWSLGGLGYDAKYSEKRAILCDLLWHFLDVSKTKTTTADIATLWSGLKLFKLKFGLLELGLRQGLLKHVESGIEYMTASEISRFLHAAMRCQVHWGNMSAPLRQKLLARIIDQANSFSPHEGSLIIMSLGKIYSLVS